MPLPSDFVSNIFQLIQSIIDELNATLTSIGADGTILRYSLQTGKLCWKFVNNEVGSQKRIAEDKKRNKMYTINGSFLSQIDCSKTNQVRPIFNQL